MEIRIIASGIQNAKEKTGAKLMERFIDEETKTIYYYSESGFPTYMAIGNYRKQSPSYEHCIASKETWEELTKNQKKYGLGNPKNHIWKQ